MAHAYDEIAQNAEATPRALCHFLLRIEARTRDSIDKRGDDLVCVEGRVVAANAQ